LPKHLRPDRRQSRADFLGRPNVDTPLSEIATDAKADDEGRVMAIEMALVASSSLEPDFERGCLIDIARRV